MLSVGATAVFSLLLFTIGCGESTVQQDDRAPDALPAASRAASPAESPVVPPTAPKAAADAPSPSSHDLSADDAIGGHTLARHVGKTDDELRARLRREPDISSASTYTDRATAEAVVGAALSSPPRSFETWRNRIGSRPNFVLHFAAHRVIGRSMGRHRSDAVPCENALIVMRWDVRRERFFVLTSYPEERR